MNKYKAKGVWYDLENQVPVERRLTLKEKDSKQFVYFGSKLEYQTYLRLLRVFKKDAIEIHPLVSLIDRPTEVFSRGLHWKPDFVIRDGNKNICWIVEAKGYVTEEFNLKLALLEVHQPILFQKTVLVFKEIRAGMFYEKAPDKVALNYLRRYFNSFSRYEVL